jgi:hypothetical protein
VTPKLAAVGPDTMMTEGKQFLATFRPSFKALSMRTHYLSTPSSRNSRAKRRELQSLLIRATNSQPNLKRNQSVRAEPYHFVFSSLPRRQYRFTSFSLRSPR